ncbi:MAG: TolC family protein, partial [Myxococcota bacterium]
FPPDKARVGDFSFETARRQLDEALADPEIDVVWAFGLLASTVAVRRANEGHLRKPVLAPFVLAPLSEPLKKRKAAKSKLAYIVLTPALARDLEAIRSTVPIRKVAYLLPRSVRTAMPSIEAGLEAEAAEAKVVLHFASGRNEPALIRELPADIDAVYVGPDPRRTEKDIKALAAALIDRRLLSFSQAGRHEVERGLFMSLNGPENAERLSRAIAVNTDAILQGEAPGRLNYVFQRTAHLVINAATAKAIGRSLSWTVLSEAELLNKNAARNARKLSLAEVAREVRDRNLSLRANEEELRAAQQSVRESFGAFLPILDASISAQWNDPGAATGINPERSAAWSGTASQVILNEPAMARLTVDRRLRDATRFDNRTAILDIVQSASIAYLNLLRALATERIQRENLKVTRMELAQADVRREVGTGGRSEVVRLQNQLATNRKNVIDAVANRNVAEIELLRLLNRASEEPIHPKDASLQSSPLMITGERLQSYMTGPDGFRVLRQFMALEALDVSPELK